MKRFPSRHAWHGDGTKESLLISDQLMQRIGIRHAKHRRKLSEAATISSACRKKVWQRNFGGLSNSNRPNEQYLSMVPS